MRQWEVVKDDVNVEGPAFQGWPRPLRELLVRRGFKDDAALEKFLAHNLKDLKDPFSLKGMAEACERIGQAFRKQETVCIYADFDLDGTSGCALLKKGFEDLGFKNLIPFQPKRLKDGYGFHAPIVEELAKNNVSLIVTCDVGITAHKAVDRARELGLDVIITDHHLPSDEIPNAYVVVNPNQPDDKSGLGYLSGAGVGFTLMRALKRYFTDHEIGTPDRLNLTSLLDCFTVATLTDMVPLVEDNRSLVQVGLRQLAQTQRPGLRSLLQALKLSGKKLTSSDVAIRFAPKLNALSRLEGELLPLDVFLIEDPGQAELVISKVLSQNQERVSLQAGAEKEALEHAQLQIHQSSLFVFSENFHRGVIGLIATSLSQKTNKPCFVASLDPEEGKLVGSARLPQDRDSSLVEALQSVSEWLLRHGGHAKAAGFEMMVEDIPQVREGLHNFFKSEVLRPTRIQYHATLKLAEFNFEMMNWMDRLQPFGVGFEMPIFLIEKARLSSVRDLRGGHLKIQLEQDGYSCEGILFSPTESQRQCLQVGQCIDLLAETQVHEWMGRQSLQLMIEDVRPTQSVPVSEEQSP